MAATAGTYELGRFSGECAKSHDPILAHQEFVAALVDALDEEGRPILKRLDFGTQAWDDAHAQQLHRQHRAGKKSQGRNHRR